MAFTRLILSASLKVLRVGPFADTKALATQIASWADDAPGDDRSQGIRDVAGVVDGILDDEAIERLESYFSFENSDTLVVRYDSESSHGTGDTFDALLTYLCNFMLSDYMIVLSAVLDPSSGWSHCCYLIDELGRQRELRDVLEGLSPQPASLCQFDL